MSLQEGLLPASPITRVAWCWIPDKLNSSVANQEKKNQTKPQHSLIYLIYCTTDCITFQTWEYDLHGNISVEQKGNKQTNPTRFTQIMQVIPAPAIKISTGIFLLVDQRSGTSFCSEHSLYDPKSHSRPSEAGQPDVLRASHSVGCWPMGRLAVSVLGEALPQRIQAEGLAHPPGWRSSVASSCSAARTGFDRPSLAALLSKLEMFLGYSLQHIPAIFLTLPNSSSLKFYPSRSLSFTF